MTIKEFKEKLSRYEDSREISMLDIIGESEYMKEKIMTVKELKELLSKYPNNCQVVICPKSSSMAMEIDSIEEVQSWDEDEPPMVGIFYDL